MTRARDNAILIGLNSIADSSSDTVIKPRTDAKDIIFQQFDGTSILEINDGAYARFTAAAVNPEATLTDASTITWNALTQSVAKVTLADNRTMGLSVRRSYRCVHINTSYSRWYRLKNCNLECSL